MGLLSATRRGASGAKAERVRAGARAQLRRELPRLRRCEEWGGAAVVSRAGAARGGRGGGPGTSSPAGLLAGRAAAWVMVGRLRAGGGWWERALGGAAVDALASGAVERCGGSCSTRWS